VRAEITNASRAVNGKRGCDDETCSKRQQRSAPVSQRSSG
jgi:hypothetical protein